MKHSPLLVLAASAAFLAVSAGVTYGEKPVPKKELSFNRDIRPILSENCYKCHGPDQKEAKAGLRLDTFELATKSRTRGAAIVPGKPDESQLLKRVSPEAKNRIMPPKSSGMKPLTEEQIATLRQWIQEGAKYEAHWSFVPPTKHEAPAAENPAWQGGFIDRFIWAKLKSKGLKPEPEADRATLLRRAALTLTGLPPTPEEVKSFLEDKRPDAYARQVDRLLASPRYGEHQARYWLDAVRYADTHGFHFDNERAIYPYRDWVVRAFNQDLPYDQFVTWQLAGDLLPNPTREQMIATGYIRLNPTTNEGGVIEEEFLAKNTFDRVDTTSTVMLGLTMACARCHDHKYDPLSHKDYFQMYAYFNSTAEAVLDGNIAAPEPTLKVPTPAEEKRLQLLDKRLSEAAGGVDEAIARTWAAEQAAGSVAMGPWEKSDAFGSETFDAAFDAASPPEKGEGAWTPVKWGPGERISIVGKPNASAYLRSTWNSGKNQTLTLSISSDDGVKVWINGAQVHSNKVLRGVNQGVDKVNAPLLRGDNTILIKLVNGGGGDEIAMTVGEPRVAAIQAMAQKGQHREAYLLYGPDSLTAQRFRSLTREASAARARIPSTLVAKEMPKPRKAFVLRRGEYNLPEEEVQRNIPSVFGTMPKGLPSNRLGLAKWIVNRRNPLAARVWVNRIWQQHFGTGLVKTSEDFGSQGEWPSHPELLDTLSVDFMDRGWSLKQLHRQILLSAAFRQSAAAAPAKWQADPENRWLARGPRFRLDGEVIRDKALLASGLLQEYKGGRGFRPYQPDGLWEALAYPDSDTARYRADRDGGIYRRSLYFFWKRTSPHPVMLTFDAPMRESCTVRRPRTNTPMQALVTLNEPAFVESARVFAGRIMKSGRTDQQRLNYAFQTALGRTPTSGEAQLLLQALNRYRQQFLLSPESAKKLTAAGLAPKDTSLPEVEKAAWALIASTLFNLDEFLTQH